MKTPTPAQFLAVADWLDECTVCGKKHEFILKYPDNPRSGGSWASPDDGHSYFRRAYMLTEGTANSVPAALRKAAQEAEMASA
jgi:hypothetical protein